MEKKLSDFESILGLTIQEALEIVKNDTWFSLNKDKDSVNRYIKYEVDPTNPNKIVNVIKKNSPDESYIQVDKSIDVSNLIPDRITNNSLAAVLFSVNGNKGPFEQIKKFIQSGGNPDTNLKKMFLAHVAWLQASGGLEGYGVKEDPLVIKELQKLEPLGQSFEVPKPETGNEIFNSPLYLNAFKLIVESEQSDSETPISKGLFMDLDRTNNYLSTIAGLTYPSEAQVGGKQKYKKSKHHKSRKSKKTKKIINQ